MNGIEKIVEKILADARESESAMLEAAAAEAQDIRERYESDAAFALARARRRGEDEAAAAADRARSGAAMTARRVTLGAKTEMIGRAYAAAEQYFKDLPDGEREDLCARLLAGALREHLEEVARRRALYGDEEEGAATYAVILGERDASAFGDGFVARFREKYRTELPPEELAKIEEQVRVGTQSGGVIAVFGPVESNCTLGILLSRHREEKEGDLCRVLFGESSGRAE